MKPLILSLVLLAQGKPAEPPGRAPDAVVHVKSVFADGPSVLLTVKVFSGNLRVEAGEATVFVKPETQVFYADLLRAERRPAPELFAQVWLKESGSDTALAIRFSKSREIAMAPPKAPPPAPVVKAPEPKPAPATPASKPVVPAPTVAKPSAPNTPPVSPVAGPIAPPAAASAGREIAFEIEQFTRLENVDVKDLPGASGGKAVLFSKPGGKARLYPRLPKGKYELRLSMQGRATNHDAVTVNVAGQQFRYTQDQWGKVADGRVKDVPRAFVEIPAEGEQRIALDFAETDVYVDRLVLVPVLPAGWTPDAEGFIRHWIVLASIPFKEGKNGAAELETRQVEEESALKPRDGQKAKVRGRELAWKRYESPDWFVDFNLFHGWKENRAEDVIAYAVCYVTADEEMKGLDLRVGSNDQAKVYVNGKEAVKHDQTRTLVADSDVARGVSLRKGENVVVLKVVNEKNAWQACLRFAHPDGRPVRNVRVTFPTP